MNSHHDIINNIPQVWRDFIGNQEFSKQYWVNIFNKLNGHQFYPSFRDIFKALELVNPDDVKVVIIGQDPYINEHQAIGIAFGVNNGVKIPPSLKNIYKEIMLEYGIKDDIKKYSEKGDISELARQGVLLLNNILTVAPNKSLSHKNIGWEYFSSAIIKALDTKRKLVFIGFGNYARDVLIENVSFNSKLIYGHPSPLNRTKPFIGCNCFKECNDVLTNLGIQPVNWTCILNFE